MVQMQMTFSHLVFRNLWGRYLPHDWARGKHPFLIVIRGWMDMKAGCALLASWEDFIVFFKILAGTFQCY
jgi:hypothetical protein